MATSVKKKNARQGGKAKQAASQSAPSAPQRRRSPSSASQTTEGFLDEGAKRDIIGVCFIVFAVVMMLFAVLPADEALVSSAASSVVHLVFGVGCYILPVVLAAIGITFLCRFKNERVSARAALGLTIIFIALLGFIALFAPIANLGVDEPDLLFSENALIGYGGYIGSGIAWLGIVLFGKVICGVILVGVMVVGAVIIGFSISKVVERVAMKRRSLDPDRRDAHSATSSGAFARIRRADNGQNAKEPLNALDQVGEEEGFDPNMTAVLGAQATDGTPAKAASKRRPGASGTKTAALGALGTDASQSRLSSESLTRRLTPKGTELSPELSEAGGEGALAQTAQMTRPLRAPQEKGSKRARATSTRKGRGARSSAQKGGAAGGAGSFPTPQDGFVLPPLSLLAQPKGKEHRRNIEGELSTVAACLQKTLADFGVEATVVDWVAGPTVTLFEVDLPAGVRVSRVTALSDDIALALASPGVRIFAPVPGTNYVGIEVPNATRQTVLLSEVLRDAQGGPLQIAIGKDVEGNSIISDLAKMPHLLIGGTTGSGKSVAINAMIMSILMRATPSEVRFILIDPKRVEFTPYNGIPHLYVPVVTEPKEAASALAWGVAEMERRLKVFSKVGARNISQYNEKVHADWARVEGQGVERGSASSVDDLSDGHFQESLGSKPGEGGGPGEGEALEEMPYIVIVIDELADLMMNIGKEIEISISRIAQLARAAGIHLIVATQRPSTNVVTGLIKANITNRIAFNVASSIDSRVVLDTPGAESLIGLGDLLLSKPELAKPLRVQGCFVSEDEINSVVEFISEQSSPEYHSEILQTNIYSLGDTDPSGGSSSGERDPLVWEAADIVVASGLGSTSNIQRRLKVGYARAGRIMDQLEEMGIVGSANGSKPREVLVDEMELETVKAFETSSE